MIRATDDWRPTPPPQWQHDDRLFLVLFWIALVVVLVLCAVGR
jgi:hypothetical protein